MVWLGVTFSFFRFGKPETPRYVDFLSQLYPPLLCTIFYSDYPSFLNTAHTAAQRNIRRENTFRLLRGGTPLLRVCQLVRRIGYPYTRETAPMTTNTCTVRVYVHKLHTVVYVTRSSRTDCRAATESQVLSNPRVGSRHFATPSSSPYFLLTLRAASSSTAWSIS